MDFQERQILRKRKKLKKRLSVIVILCAGIAIGAAFVLLSNKTIVIVPDSKKDLTYSESAENKGINDVTTSSKKKIAIDAGHQMVGNSQQEPIAPGSSQTKAKVASGTTGVVTKVPEYAVTLDVSLLLKQELQSRGYSVIMIRETNDVNISNSERAQIANEANVDAFIRIHCNGVDDSGVKGALTMCQTAGNPYCSSQYGNSRKLSGCILSGLCSETGAKNRGVIETDSMSGINWCKVPVTIVEMGFMSNPDEDRLLSDKAYQDKLARGIANGIDEYFK